MTSARALHPLHGVHDPTAGTPIRAFPSVRRTTTVDMLRPEGLQGPLVLAGRGRDVRTGRDGTATVLAADGLRAVVDYPGGWDLVALETAQDLPELQGLLGVRVSAGFRTRLAELAPQLRGQGSLLHQLLDDLPVTTLVSGHAVGAGGASRGRTQLLLPPDGCAGFVTGGTLMAEFEERGRPPVTTGPDAPALVDPNDAWSWHPLDALPVHGMRRARRLDVRGDPASGQTDVDAMFRDSYVRPDGVETIIHEYTLALVADGDGRIRSCEATPRVLPWRECPLAAASAGRLVGQSFADLRQQVRQDFTGTSTCTHLNDLLRSLEDVPVLRALVVPTD